MQRFFLLFVYTIVLKMENENLDVRDLIEECIRNNRKAQLTLYKQYVKSMYNTSLRIVKNTVTAEDIVQEAFLSAFRSLKNFRHEVPFSTWLRRIVINKSLDHIRKQKNSLLEFYNEINDLPDTSGIENIDDNSVKKKKLLEHIREEMMLLPDGYRVIFSLFYFEGYDHEEIGQILNISASSSRSQLTRAKQRIIKNLQQKKPNDA